MEENISTISNEEEVFIFSDTNEEELIEEAQSPLFTDESDPFSWGSYMSSLGLIMLMLFFLYAILWFMRKYGKGNFVPKTSNFTRSDLRLEAQLPLGSKKTLYVVKYLNKRLLIGASDTSVTLLSEDYVFPNEEAEENIKNFEETVKSFTEEDT